MAKPTTPKRTSGPSEYTNAELLAALGEARPTNWNLDAPKWAIRQICAMRELILRDRRAAKARSGNVSTSPISPRDLEKSHGLRAVATSMRLGESIVPEGIVLRPGLAKELAGVFDDAWEHQGGMRHPDECDSSRDEINALRAELGIILGVAL